MDNQNFQQQFNAPKQSNTNVLALVSVILAGVSLVMAILGSALLCSCSAQKSIDNSMSSVMSMFSGKFEGFYSTSAVLILGLVAALMAATAVVLAFISMKSGKSILAQIAICAGGFAFLYAILPILTVCGYNCSLNSHMEDSIADSLKGLSDFEF